MKFIIIGLGIYGENLALDLTSLGHEVIGCDCDRSHVEALKENISTVYHIDSTEETQLQVLPLRNVDLIIVAIGENFGASIKTVALLKKNGVEHIYARAIDKLHEAILRSFDIDRIITPEQRAASDLSHELEFGTSIRSLRIDSENVVLSLDVPENFYGIKYTNLRHQLAENFGIMLIAACRPVEKTNILGLRRPEMSLLYLSTAPEPMAAAGDRITVFGTRKAMHELARLME